MNTEQNPVFDKFVTKAIQQKNFKNLHMLSYTNEPNYINISAKSGISFTRLKL